MGNTFRPASPVNWMLWTGISMVLLVGLVAVLGPSLSPADPLKESFIGRVGERFIRPPFPPNTVEGYPLGSDEWGRDLVSRLLWAVRPTMTLVLVVAAARLVIGIFIGLVSGWLSNRFSRLLDTLISVSLAAPVFFIALCVIALMGSKWGIWAFIAGLSLTGWAEVARIVREQTRAIKSQTFVEASRAMGASSEQQVLSHILPHVLPLMWIQMTFEIAATLLTTAALGFLGYYMNGIWIPIEDWIGQRATGYPELGEMLGSATTQRVPWNALFAGTVIVFIVLAFNILGAGLRLQLSPDRQRRRAEMTRATARAGAWMEDRLYSGVESVMRFASSNGMIALLAVVLIGGMWMIWSSQNIQESASVVNIPGGHFWASSKRDAQGTYWASVKGPSSGDIVWRYQNDEPFSGAPVVNAAGQIFLSSSDGSLVALDGDGELLWKTSYPPIADGTPAYSVGPIALAPNGNILTVDQASRLIAIDPQGEVAWVANFLEGEQAISGPVVGEDGTTYFATGTRLIAVYPSGKLRFLINLPTYSVIDPTPRLSLDGRYLFFEDTVVNAQTGKMDFDQTPPPMDSYVVGADGDNYLRGQDGMQGWLPTDTGYVLAKKSEFDERTLGLGFRRPQESGVSPGGNVWVLYSAGFDIPRFVWFDVERASFQVIDFPNRTAQMIGLDQAGRIFICVDAFTPPAFCRALNVSTGSVEWEAALPDSAGITGGAIVPGRLIVGIGNSVFAIGEQRGQQVVAGSTAAPHATSGCTGGDCEPPGPTPTVQVSVFLPVIGGQVDPTATATP